jgi:GNAT superfamily N-acetyltransferase
MDSLRVIPYVAEHSALVAELQLHLASPDPGLNARYFDWKYQRNPYIREPLVYLAFCGDRLAGMRGAFGTKWEFGDSRECVVMPYADDLVVHPEYRTLGLHRRIMEVALADLKRRGFRFVVNLSASKVTALQSLRMKWRSVGNVEPLRRRTHRRVVVDRLIALADRAPVLWRCARALNRVAGAPVGREFDRIDARLARSDGGAAQGSVFIATEPLARDMAELVERVPRDGRLRHVRDEAFFHWRFANPLRHYRFLYAAGERLEGYLVLSCSLGSDARHRVCIVDWEAENDDVREALLAAAIDHGRFPELFTWRSATSAAGRPLLDRYGFKPANEAYSVSHLVRKLDDGETDGAWRLDGVHVDDPRAWDLRMIVSMHG